MVGSIRGGGRGSRNSRECRLVGAVPEPPVAAPDPCPAVPVSVARGPLHARGVRPGRGGQLAAGSGNVSAAGEAYGGGHVCPVELRLEGVDGAP